MSGFNRENIVCYTLIMSHLDLLYANDWLSDEDFDMLEKVFAQKYQIPENSIFKYKHQKEFAIYKGFPH